MDRERYRYLHAVSRARMRYGIELTFEEYQRLNETFREGRYSEGRVNGDGDIEGWALVQSTWVCAHFKKREGLIATFLPAPPPLKQVRAPAFAERPPTEAVTTTKLERARLHVRGLELQKEIRAQRVQWYRQQMHRAVEDLRAGRSDQARQLLTNALQAKD